MGYLPFNIQLHEKPVIVIGGGKVAERKVGNILPAGARITIISPTITFTLTQLRESGAVTHIHRKFQSGDLAGAFLVIAATNDRETNKVVAAEAQSIGILAEITDNPAAGNATSPAIFRQGDLTIAISTNNQAPSLAVAVKNELGRLFGVEYAKSVKLLGIVREKLLTDGGASTYNRQVLNDLSDKLPALFAAGADKEIDRLLQTQLGQDFTLSALFNGLEDTP